jgi:hypothetical protein
MPEKHWLSKCPTADESSATYTSSMHRAKKKEQCYEARTTSSTCFFVLSMHYVSFDRTLHILCSHADKPFNCSVCLDWPNPLVAGQAHALRWGKITLRYAVQFHSTVIRSVTPGNHDASHGLRESEGKSKSKRCPVARQCRSLQFALDEKCTICNPQVLIASSLSMTSRDHDAGPGFVKAKAKAKAKSKTENKSSTVRSKSHAHRKLHNL